MKVICFETSTNCISERNYRKCNWWHSFCNARKVISLYAHFYCLPHYVRRSLRLQQFHPMQCSSRHPQMSASTQNADRKLRSNDQRWWHLPNSFTLGVSVVVLCAWCSQATSLPKQTNKPPLAEEVAHAQGSPGFSLVHNGNLKWVHCDLNTSLFVYLVYAWTPAAIETRKEGDFR